MLATAFGAHRDRVYVRPEGLRFPFHVEQSHVEQAGCLEAGIAARS
jgi:hypothetical protein